MKKSKRLFFLSFFLLMPVIMPAQKQQGIVKTRGRMLNGVLQRGKGLPDAMVQIKEHSSVKSEKDGTFSFPLRTKNYLVESVKKQGYQLVDNDACRSYRYSDEPVCLVMETPEQQRSDLLAAERKIRRNLQRQLQEREEEIEALKVSQKEKDSLLHIVYQQQTDNERLIHDMAKRYSTLDYDQLDEFYRQVSSYIENGDLTRADSLLRTRGDINAQVETIIQQGQAIQEQSELLHKADSVHKRDVEEAARRCYGYYETFCAQHQNDSAAYYLDKRTTLDSTNIDWLNKAALFFDDYMADYDKALQYYRKVLRLALVQYGENSEWAATAYNNLGEFYNYQDDSLKALDYLKKSLEIKKSIYGSEHQDVATSYHNIGGVYAEAGNQILALQYFEKALAIRQRTLDSEHPDLATSYNTIGGVYFRQKDYTNALEYFNKSLLIREKVLGEDHFETGTSYNNIGMAYDELGNLTQAMDYYTKAMKVKEKILSQNHPSLAIIIGNIATIYNRWGDYNKSLSMQEKALSIRINAFGSDNRYVALSYNNIGKIYRNMKDYPRALYYYQKALAVFEKTIGHDNPTTKIVQENVNFVKEQMEKNDSSNEQ